jgi:protein HIRA/HIR1
VCSDIVCYSVLMVRSNRPPLHTCTDSLCRNVKKGTAVFAPISVSPLLSPNTVITGVSVRPNGVPVVQLSSGTAFTYDAALCTFVQLADKWYIGGSDAWQGRQRGGAANKGVLGALELAISEGVPAGEGADTPRPQWWAAALTLGHLDGKMHAARLLESPVEYKQALLVYAQRLAGEGFRGKAEELVKELFGPLYWYARARCCQAVC